MVDHLVRPFVRSATVVLLFGLAFVASLFFNGVRIEFFAVSMGLLLFLLLSALWRGYEPGLKIPKTLLAIALTLFWVWLAATLLWSPVPYVSTVNFWWVGSAVLVFWVMTLLPEERLSSSGIHMAVLAIGLMLALLSIYQQLSLNMQAQSTFLTRNSHAALMCLIAIPTSARFLRMSGSTPAATWASWLLISVLFVLYFSLALTSSRGATLGLVIGIAVMIAVIYRHVTRPRLVVLAGIVLLAYIAANFLLRGEVAMRLGTLADFTKADPGRFLIWERSWQMLLDAPWWGVGLGTYWLHWPPYRHPLDGSAGFYVHNDYLQIWIETGLPGLLLLLAVYGSVVITFVRLLRHVRLDTAVIIESAGLFGGLLAIATHTFFDFDFYIHPIQLVMGLALARLHALYLGHVPTKSVVVEPARFVGRRAYRTISALLVLLPLLYFAALGTSAVLTYQARELAMKAKWAEASNALSRAARLTPASDLILTSHADLFRQAMTQLPRDAKERVALYREALALLEDAERANPLRPQVLFIRALLYQQNTDLAGSEWVANAERAYVTALKLDPLAYRAREAYARFLLGQGRKQQAREALEGGIAYSYPGKAVAGYYLLTAEVRRQQGDEEGAAALKRKAAEVVGQPLNLPMPAPEMIPDRQHSKDRRSG